MNVDICASFCDLVMAFVPEEDLKSIQKTLTHMWAEEEPDSDDEASDDDQAMADTKAFWQSDGKTMV